jgi:hypothetical protein
MGATDRRFALGRDPLAQAVGDDESTVDTHFRFS